MASFRVATSRAYARSDHAITFWRAVLPDGKRPRLGDTMGLILLIVLLILLLGGLPRWSHSKDWGYGPSGVLGLVLVVVLILVLLGHIPRGF